MKSDNYLTLCLEQASKSPLHYRHGSIIVRGGKVIGQGFNDYRPGFEGGALKTGRLTKSLDGPAIAELKRRFKGKLEEKEKSKDIPNPNPNPNRKKPSDTSTSIFKPFESQGGGHLANEPLSMHSEMMAIHSALAASSTLASSAVAREKPCFKLSGGGKRAARLRRRQALAAFKSRVLNRVHLNQTRRDVEDVEEDGEEEEGRKELKQVLKKGKGHHHQGKYQYQYHHQHHKGQQQQLSKKLISESGVNHGSSANQTSRSSSTSNCKRRSTSVDDGSMNSKERQHLINSGPLLLPKSRTNQTSASVKDRTKNPRLNNADLYVARLGSNKPDSSASSFSCCSPNPPDYLPPMISEASLYPSPASSPTGSLHEEYLSQSLSQSLPRSSTPTLVSPTGSPFKLSSSPPPQNPSLLDVRASRPCYRCISYMAAVGIKRVFWTREDGSWEGGKVRNMVDALDACMAGLAGGGGGGGAELAGMGVFVTKHEVLMLRRRMGEG
ncbi:hypothetical protein K402DRAFT_446175 [Aulographum hederae CBS 113979]|uniref:CMP/dCMP-type deaminase domain-containing protein n=1 Tax=Aulographum hederae CBS 113979 TaxID=1176131 RepID=A0A6G1H1A4_9PEZI|nr:hypothetical protein K402DRAFT_446175 [Aulographum hederae CBS 113979]